MKVLVAGGGIAGLAAAIAVRSAGHEVEVLERAPELSDIGAGLALFPNGIRALAALGIKEVPGLAVRRLALQTWRGRAIAETPVKEFRDRYGHDLMLLHRAELRSSLLQALVPDAIRLASEVVGFAQDPETVVATLSSGEQRRGDLLLGADGLHSAVRAALLADGQPRYSGATCWRGVTAFEADPPSGLNWWGPGSEFGLFPLSRGRVYWFAVANRPENQANGANGRKADVLAEFGNWPPPVASVVEATPVDVILRNDLYDRPPGRSWTSGRVTLLGDAAHPMLPNAAQGASQALEDAVALGEMLADHSPKEALKAYEARRLKRANRFVSQARQTARLVQSTNPALQVVRNLTIGHLPHSFLLRQLDAALKLRR